MSEIIFFCYAFTERHIKTSHNPTKTISKKFYPPPICFYESQPKLFMASYHIYSSVASTVNMIPSAEI